MKVPSYKSLVLDVGGVFLLYDVEHVTAIPPRRLKDALDSPWWHEYERGNISQHDCDVHIAKDFNFDLKLWRDALNQMRGSLTPNTAFINAVKQLKLTYPHLGVYGMTNMPKEDFEILAPVMNGWGIFDTIQPSSILGHRKPDLTCYEKFGEEFKAEPSTCIFIDDCLENVIAAHSLGFHGLLFENSTSTLTSLLNLLGDPVARGIDFLNRHAKSLFSETDAGVPQPDNYSQLLILQCTDNCGLVTLEKKGPLWNYFIGEPKFAETTYPVDSDTTSLAMVVLDGVPVEEKEFAMEKILSNINPDGLPLCWFDPDRPRFCHCIGANVFRFFYLNSQGHRLSATYAYLNRLLKTKAYLLGTRYYESPDWLLYILADLCGERHNDSALQDMRELLYKEVQERMGCDSDILSAALRLVAAQRLGLPNQRDLDTVLRSQQADGGWERVWLWRYGKQKVKIGSRGVVTAMAVRGIQMARDQPPNEQPNEQPNGVNKSSSSFSSHSNSRCITI